MLIINKNFILNLSTIIFFIAIISSINNISSINKNNISNINKNNISISSIILKRKFFLITLMFNFLNVLKICDTTLKFSCPSKIRIVEILDDATKDSASACIVLTNNKYDKVICLMGIKKHKKFLSLQECQANSANSTIKLPAFCKIEILLGNFCGQLSSFWIQDKITNEHVIFVNKFKKKVTPIDGFFLKKGSFFIVITLKSRKTFVYSLEIV